MKKLIIDVMLSGGVNSTASLNTDTIPFLSSTSLM